MDCKTCSADKSCYECGKPTSGERVEAQINSIACAVSALVEQVAGEPQPITLMVHTADGTKYVSNARKDRVVITLEKLTAQIRAETQRSEGKPDDRR